MLDLVIRGGQDPDWSSWGQRRQGKIHRPITGKNHG